jgi:hypothetical protein
MPVKNSIRRSKSTRLSRHAFVERTMKFMKSMKLTTGMDTAIVLPLLGVVVVAMLIAAQTRNADEVTKTATTEVDSSIIDGSGVPPVAIAHDAELAVAQNQFAKAPVTISGCLERDDETFRLKDTSGVDAPRSRSWKSAFLKKGAAPVEVVDASKRLKLTNHVGQRISVTGTLNDGEMQVRSLRRIAASCKNATPKVTV